MSTDCQKDKRVDRSEINMTPEQSETLENFWNQEKNPMPSILTLAKLTQTTGLGVKQIGAWLLRRHEEEENVQTQPLISGAATAALNTASSFSAPKIIETLNEVRERFRRVLHLYAIADKHTKKTLEEECKDVGAALEKIKPFTQDQLKTLDEWEDDFLLDVFPDNADSEMTKQFRHKILSIWDRVIVFSKAAEITRLDAATTIVHLANANEGTASAPRTTPWGFLDLFKKIQQETGNLDDGNDSDNDSVGSSCSAGAE